MAHVREQELWERPDFLSVILVVYNMQRVAPRTLLSLAVPYQRDVSPEDYEIVVVENGSTERLDRAAIESIAPNTRYFYLEDPPPSPAYAINFGVDQARGDILGIMIDGAHMLTPGVLRWSLAPFHYSPNPVVTAPRFFLGPESQIDSVPKGYSEEEEDRLLETIRWPRNGYRLYEIGVPYRYEFKDGPPKLFWFVRQFESNCLFVRRSAFDAVGGCDLRFDIPGGGCLMPDLYRELCELDDAEIVQILGEASFHQVHGGVSTSVTRETQRQLWETYTAQYESIRGRPFEMSQKERQFIGHMPHQQAARLMLTG